MHTFDTVPHTFGAAFVEARVHAHLAAQLVAAAGVTLVAPDMDFHFSSTTFDPETGALVGSPLPGDRRVRLVLADLRLEVLAGDAVTDRRLLGGSTMAEAGEWLGEILGRPLVYPSWELPTGPIEMFGPFERHAFDLATLADWYAAAHDTFASFVPPAGQASDVRVWPHHFDLAVLVTLEHGRTVGMGLTPGDGSFALPYLYVTPWPYPDERVTPPLPVGTWCKEPWYGAVLEAASVRDQATVDTFLRAAFDLCAA